MCELDPDVVRWGLHQIDLLPMTPSPQTVTFYEKDLSRTESVREYFCDSTFPALYSDGGVTSSILENDEVLAHALQEELSILDASEAAGCIFSEEKYKKEAVLAQNWPCPPGALSTVHGNLEEPGIVESFSSEEYSGMDDPDQMPGIVDESVLDGELGKRLNQMIPIPHVLKTNGEIPSADEAMSDHERLLSRLKVYDLVELQISGDGNCQFRSLSDQIYRTPDHHRLVREQVVKQLKLQPELYENYVPMPYNEYLEKMSSNAEWGDHVTLQAAADWFGMKIFVLTSFKDTCYIEILPAAQKTNRIIFLSFWAEVHYNSIYPSEEFPDVRRLSVERKKKKQWCWL